MSYFLSEKEKGINSMDATIMVESQAVNKDVYNYVKCYASAVGSVMKMINM